MSLPSCLRWQADMTLSQKSDLVRAYLSPVAQMTMPCISDKHWATVFSAARVLEARDHYVMQATDKRVYRMQRLALNAVVVMQVWVPKENDAPLHITLVAHPIHPTLKHLTYLVRYCTVYDPRQRLSARTIAIGLLWLRHANGHMTLRLELRRSPVVHLPSWLARCRMAALSSRIVEDEELQAGE